MLIQIIAHTPAWVFAVFALLAWLGSKQLTAGSSHLHRVVAVPLAMVALAVSGIASAFGDSHTRLPALTAWACAALPTLALIGRLAAPAGVRFDAASRRFFQPGSGVPLALMMAIFFTKYSVGVTLAFHPDWAHQTGFAVGISLLYGLFSGVFAGRALRLWRLAFQQRGAAA